MTETPACILIADDDFPVLDMLNEYFLNLGYRVITATTGTEALERTLSAMPDLVLLDVNMPEFDGFEVCRHIREHLDCPIIFLTARIEDADALTGFEVGGDDYVLKPFSLAVLGARVQAHLHRHFKTSQSRTADTMVHFSNDIAVDYRGHQVLVAVTPLDLTSREFELIAFLSKHPGRVFDRASLHEHVWGWNNESDSRVVTEFVHRVRRKFTEAGCTAEPVETVWGVGYRWNA